MIRIKKVLQSLKHIVSKDALRAVLTGVLYNPKDKSFSATNASIMVTIKQNETDNKTDDFPVVNTRGSVECEEEVILNPKLFDGIKTFTKSTVFPAIDNAGLLYIDEDGFQNIVVSDGRKSSNTATSPLIAGKYPDMSVVKWSGLPVISFGLTKSMLLSLANFVKDFHENDHDVIAFSYNGYKRPLEFSGSNLAGDSYKGAVSQATNSSVKNLVKYYVLSKSEDKVIGEYDTLSASVVKCEENNDDYYVIAGAKQISTRDITIAIADGKDPVQMEKRYYSNDQEQETEKNSEQNTDEDTGEDDVKSPDEKMIFFHKLGKSVDEVADILDMDVEDVISAFTRLGLTEVVAEETLSENTESENKSSDKWSEEDEEELEFLWKAGRNVSFLVDYFKLNNGSQIINKLSDMGLWTPTLIANAEDDEDDNEETQTEEDKQTSEIYSLYGTWDKIREKTKVDDVFLTMISDRFRYITFSKHLLTVLANHRAVISSVGKYDNTLIYATIHKENVEDAIKTMVKNGLKVVCADSIDSYEHRSANRQHPETQDKNIYPNHGKRWSTEDEEKLEFLFKVGKTVEDLSEIFGRKNDGIQMRLVKLGLVEGSSNYQKKETAPVKEPVPDNNVEADKQSDETIIILHEKGYDKPEIAAIVGRSMDYIENVLISKESNKNEGIVMDSSVEDGVQKFIFKSLGDKYGRYVLGGVKVIAPDSDDDGYEYIESEDTFITNTDAIKDGDCMGRITTALEYDILDNQFYVYDHNNKRKYTYTFDGESVIVENALYDAEVEDDNDDDSSLVDMADSQDAAEFTSNFNTIDIKVGMKIRTFSSDKYSHDKSQSIKMIEKNSFDIFGKELEVFGTYHPTGFIIEKFPFFVIPYNVIESVKK